MSHISKRVCVESSIDCIEPTLRSRPWRLTLDAARASEANKHHVREATLRTYANRPLGRAAVTFACDTTEGANREDCLGFTRARGTCRRHKWAPLGARAGCGMRAYHGSHDEWPWRGVAVEMRSARVTIIHSRRKCPLQWTGVIQCAHVSTFLQHKHADLGGPGMPKHQRPRD